MHSRSNCRLIFIKDMKHFSLPEEGGLKIERRPSDILHSFDRIPTEVFQDVESAARNIADVIISAINSHRPDRPFKLGVTTGRTPLSLYQELRERFIAGEVSFKNVEIFSIDEYYPSRPTDSQSRNRRLHDDILNEIDILPENIHILDGTIDVKEIDSYCKTFDEKARNLDLLVVGVGDGGQVGFNESGSTRTCRTRLVHLPYKSRKRQAKNFNGNLLETPEMALTMGIGTMMSARQIILMAWGEDKSRAIKQIAEEPETPNCPASYFQAHDNAKLYVDKVGAEFLTRNEAPWMIGPCNWTRKMRRKAVIWLCRKVGKPILKLSLQDYLDNSLGELLEEYGPYDKINIDIFNDLQHTITGWPGGKPGSDDLTRPVSSKPFPKTVLIFSPHPDDDVISMGGTFIRLVHQGHNVHVAYETSGNVAVHDDVVIQHTDAAVQLGFEDRFEQVEKLIASKIPGAAEPKELLALKAAIRRSEARGACRSFGLAMDHVHFLNLPFYESGGIIKLPRTQADVDIIKNLIKEVNPNQIYMAGDLADPHGTHRVCTEAALEAIEQLHEEGFKGIDECAIWMYRGAWMEWDLGSVDMAVPLSPDEVIEKRHAIYRHLSQKDIMPFPGDDTREFWQRAEDRTQATARLYDSLGMAEYQAMEVFLRLK